MKFESAYSSTIIIMTYLLIVFMYIYIIYQLIICIAPLHCITYSYIFTMQSWLSIYVCVHTLWAIETSVARAKDQASPCRCGYITIPYIINLQSPYQKSQLPKVTHSHTDTQENTKQIYLTISGGNAALTLNCTTIVLLCNMTMYIVKIHLLIHAV